MHIAQNIKSLISNIFLTFFLVNINKRSVQSMQPMLFPRKKHFEKYLVKSKHVWCKLKDLLTPKCSMMSLGKNTNMFGLCNIQTHLKIIIWEFFIVFLVEVRLDDYIKKKHTSWTKFFCIVFTVQLVHQKCSIIKVTTPTSIQGHLLFKMSSTHACTCTHRIYLHKTKS